MSVHYELPHCSAAHLALCSAAEVVRADGWKHFSRFGHLMLSGMQKKFGHCCGPSPKPGGQSTVLSAV